MVPVPASDRPYGALTAPLQHKYASFLVVQFAALLPLDQEVDGAIPEPAPLSRHAFDAELRDGAQLRDGTQLKVNRDTVEWLVGVEIVYKKLAPRVSAGWKVKAGGRRQAASITLM